MYRDALGQESVHLVDGDDDAVARQIVEVDVLWISDQVFERGIADDAVDVAAAARQRAAGTGAGSATAAASGNLLADGTATRPTDGLVAGP